MPSQHLVKHKTLLQSCPSEGSSKSVWLQPHINTLWQWKGYRILKVNSKFEIESCASDICFTTKNANIFLFFETEHHILLIYGLNINRSFIVLVAY